MGRTTYRLTRMGGQGGREIVYRDMDIRACGQMVAYCAADNLGVSGGAATKHGMAAEDAFRMGHSYELGGYYFYAVEEC